MINIEMVQVEKKEYENYISGIQNAVEENYNLCGEAKTYHKLEGVIVACKTETDESVIYEIKQ